MAGMTRQILRVYKSLRYHDPKPCVGVLILRDDAVLLAKRRREPFQGMWDIPGGFIHEGEHPADAARREIREETGLEIELVDLLGFFMDVYGPEEDHVLNICYTTRVVGGEAVAQDDITEIAWFPLDDLPDEIAFTWSSAALACLKRRDSAMLKPCEGG